jgi:acyl-CoA hydrolase
VSNILTSVEQCVDQTIAKVGSDLVLGAPLGLGKPVQLMNAFYQRAAADPSVSLHIVTALCLEIPKPGSAVEASLANPIMERLFGDYEELAFLEAYRQDRLPSNIRVTELYFKAGSMKNRPGPQQNYVSANYTHIVRDMRGLGVNVMTQLVAARDTANGLSISLSSNPDLTLEIIDLARGQRDEPFALLGQIHDDMPFMELDAEVSPDDFDFIVRNPQYNKTLFAVPNAAVPLQDYATALHASSLVVDGGTLQIGIGALGDAVAKACILRHQSNSEYLSILRDLSPTTGLAKEKLGPFQEGLYISTEMFVNGMMHLIEQGIVKRKVYDSLALQRGLNDGCISETVDERLFQYCRDCGLMPRRLTSSSLGEIQYWGIVADDVSLVEDELLLRGQSMPNDMDDPQVRTALLLGVAGQVLRNGRILHGGFFLGPRDFYDKLSNLDATGRAQICMTGVRRTNQLLLDYPLYCAQRRDARFINTGMMVSLNGAVASDALEDGTVVSGVGGQYNFVAMAHDLPGARSVLCIRSTRGHGKNLKSNVVPFYGYTTIPKHLRDIVVTEYGVADLRGRSDSEVIQRLINIADSRFQDELLEFAKSHGKVPQDYRIPESARGNSPERLQRILAPYQHNGMLSDYPFGSELTEQELALAASLRKIKALSEEPAHFLTAAFKALLHKADPQAARPFLERVHLEHPETTRDFLVQQLLLLDLEEKGMLKVS